MVKYRIPTEYEPRIESWLEQRGIPFEVSVPVRGKGLFVFVDFNACKDPRRRKVLEEMFQRQLQKIHADRGGKEK